MSKRRFYSIEQKKEVIRLVVESKKPVEQVSREQDIPANTIHSWIREARLKHALPTPSSESAEEKIRRLERENAQLREEATILKKAMAYFAQPPKK